MTGTPNAPLQVRRGAFESHEAFGSLHGRGVSQP